MIVMKIAQDWKGEKKREREREKEKKKRKIKKIKCYMCAFEVTEASKTTAER
jgi:hypothetical protein